MVNTLAAHVIKRSKKAGLPPGSLVYVGSKKEESVKITIMDYDASKFQEKEAKTVDDCFKFKEKPTVTWINVDGIHRPEIIEKLGEHFGLHSLMQEDILNTNQRPKIEDFEKHLFIVLKMLHYDDKTNEIHSEQVSIVLGPTFVISFQEKEGDVFNTIRERIRSGKGMIRKTGTDYLAYALTDAIVDSYFLMLEKIEERIDTLEEHLVTNPKPETLQDIHDLKTEMIYLRKAVWPLREVISGMQRRDSPLILKSTQVYLRDVYDHTIQIIDNIESFRDMLSGMVDLYLSSVSNKMNEVMKVLTVIATIFIPLTFVTGLYGMNFNTHASPFSMPELNWYWGYPALWVVMIVVSLSLFLYFRKKMWV